MSYGTTGNVADLPKSDHGSSIRGTDPVTGADSSSAPRDNGEETAGSDEAAHSVPFRQRAKAFYERNMGLLFVFIAQIFASVVSFATGSVHFPADRSCQDVHDYQAP